MGMNMQTKLRDFHQARWDEPIIYELSKPGERGVLIPEFDGGEVDVCVPEGMRRSGEANLPEMGQMRVLRHFLRLSQENLGADLNIDVGQGTCTMKYSPKINEQLAANPKVAELHPYQDESSVQGLLRMIHETDLCLREISACSKVADPMPCSPLPRSSGNGSTAGENRIPGMKSLPRFSLTLQMLR
jgi:glycine dehydrogenase subunit 2